MANNDFFVSALQLLIDLIVFHKFPSYEGDQVVLRVVFRVYGHYEGKDKKWTSHDGPVRIDEGSAGGPLAPGRFGWGESANVNTYRGGRPRETGVLYDARFGTRVFCRESWGVRSGPGK